MNRWLFFWRRLRRQLWVRASAYAGLGLAASLLAVLLAVAGIVLVLGLEWFAGRRQPMTEGV